MRELAKAALDGNPSVAAKAKEALKASLLLDDLNLEYFLALYAAFNSPKAKESLVLFEPGKSVEGKQIAYPTAIAPKEMLSQLPFVDYATIAAPKAGYAEQASRALLWIKKMQAGTGSSMTRTSYLARKRGLPAEKVSIGAKGTDLYLDSVGRGDVSLAEAQILQAIHDASSGTFAEVALHDIVSSETEASLSAIWEKPSLPDPTKTYAELLRDLPGTQRFGRSYQNYIPTIDEAGNISLNRQAPGGHALFAVDALRAAYIDTLRPRPAKDSSDVVSAIGNGEDLSSTPDAAMVGWMLEHKVPIVMVTTRKTENDLKGGQIALVKQANGGTYATIVEQAQAKEAGQLALFEQLGLRPGDGVAFFNTNMALFNYTVLTPKIKKLVAEIGERELMQVIAPELIQNKKTQVDRDGLTRKYTQLEGAMGSSLLRLDRFWRERYGEPLVHFINVGRESRTSFFSPIKTAFDFFMQFHSDRFALDRESMRLVNKRPGQLPAVTLGDKASDDKYWADVENVLEAFHGTSILDLDLLEVEGRVCFRGTILRGQVKVINASGGVLDLAKRLNQGKPGPVVLENTALTF